MAVDKADGRSLSVGRFLELSLVRSMERALGIDTLGGRASDVGNTDTGGPGYYALMQLREFVPSRVVEAVVHGLDLTDALGATPMATAEGVAMTAAIFDELLARRTVAGRPADLADDMAWVRAASGRGPHDDPRLPLIG